MEVQESGRNNLIDRVVMKLQFSSSDLIYTMFFYKYFFEKINLEIIIFNYINREYYEEVFIQETEIFCEIVK